MSWKLFVTRDFDTSDVVEVAAEGSLSIPYTLFDETDAPTGKLKTGAMFCSLNHIDGTKYRPGPTVIKCANADIRLATEVGIMDNAGFDPNGELWGQDLTIPDSIGPGDASFAVQFRRVANGLQVDMLAALGFPESGYFDIVIGDPGWYLTSATGVRDDSVGFMRFMDPADISDLDWYPEIVEIFSPDVAQMSVRVRNGSTGTFIRGPLVPVPNFPDSVYDGPITLPVTIPADRDVAEGESVHVEVEWWATDGPSSLTWYGPESDGTMVLAAGTHDLVLDRITVDPPELLRSGLTKYYVFFGNGTAAFAPGLITP